jgi:FeS assembly SUF system regulator
MLRISKMTDYAIVVMSYFGHAERGRYFSALELATMSRLPRATVTKLLKQLAKANLLVSKRGVEGGYALQREAGAIAISDIIQVMEGPIALTDCSHPEEHLCDIESSCPVRSNWLRINARVVDALRALTLDEMATPLALMDGRQGSPVGVPIPNNLVALSTLRKL